MTGVLIALALVQAAAPAPAPAPAPAARPGSVQQAFDAATALDEKGTAEARIAAWTAIERRVAANKRTTAIVRVREGSALLAANRTEEAVSKTRAGLADLPIADATLHDDRVSGMMTLGLAAERELDYAGAAAHYASIEPIATTPLDRLRSFIGVARTAAFVDPGAAQAAIAKADAVIATMKADNALKGMVRRINAELLLNKGDIAGAKVQAAESVRLYGGLTESTNLDDVAARSDFAIAALLSGDGDKAREYLAYTGAGRVPNQQFDPGIGMKAPDCGGEAELKPSDLAVIEFSVDDDGSVFAVRPVYAAGGGSVALEFARAAQSWSWTPESAKALPLFFRNRVRVEMRCSTAFERPSIYTYIDGELGRWLAEKGVAADAPPTGSDVAVAPILRARLATLEREKGPDALALVPVLHLLATNALTGGQEVAALGARELAILDHAGAPPLVKLAAERFGAAGEQHLSVDKLRQRADATIARYAVDPQARAAARLMAADWWEKDQAREAALLGQVGDDPALPAGNPLKVAALVRLASLEQQRGDAQAARAAFEKSALPPEACALVDAPPRMLHAGGTFPNEALQWGFEGWTKIQYDIDPQGRAVNPRAVIAYPPFVFTQAGTKTMAGAQFAKTYRPDGGLGCGGRQTGVRFALPH